MKPSCPASSITERLSLVPDGADAALLMRHAEREEIPAGTFGFDVPLTAHGATSAERLGEALSGRPLDRIAASPAPRCVHTAEAIMRGGEWSGEVARDWRLGEPGPFIVDSKVSGDLFLSIGILEIVRRQLSDTMPPPGMRATVEGAALLRGLVTSNLEQHGRLNVYVTHDAILSVFVAHLFQLSIDQIRWPDYLDGLLLWRSGKRLHFTWRGLHQASHPIGG